MQQQEPPTAIGPDTVGPNPVDYVHPCVGFSAPGSYEELCPQMTNYDLSDGRERQFNLSLVFLDRGDEKQVQ